MSLKRALPYQLKQSGFLNLFIREDDDKIVGLNFIFDDEKPPRPICEIAVQFSSRKTSIYSGFK